MLHRALSFLLQAMGEQYKSLCRASLRLEYIHANSTTHDFLFGAIAEIIDNSRDAGATTLHIYSENNPDFQGGHLLCFLDDGCGMNPKETCDLVFFGRSNKCLGTTQFIGRYGNGLKSGSMRIGKDFVLFTKKEDTMTCLLFSQTFCETEGLEELIVPMCNWSQGTKIPVLESTEQFKLQMSVICKYSPFKTEYELLQQFDLIYNNHGTLIIIYNLKLMINGKPELDFITDAADILNAGMESFNVHSEFRSLRAYTSVLYFDPRMKIFIEAERISNKPLTHSLYRPRMYAYKMPYFKAKTAEEDFGKTETRKTKLRKITHSPFEEKDEDSILENSNKRFNEKIEEKQRDRKQLQCVYLTYGINIENRSQDGMFIYYNSRLIRMHERVGKQVSKQLSAGVLGLVNLPSESLLPSHNKQSFLNESGYHHLLRYMGLFLDQYLKDSGRTQKGADHFWREFGYISGMSNWFDVPSGEITFKRRRGSEIPYIIQCDMCLKWRTLPFAAENTELCSEIWTCADHPDVSKNSCAEPEQLPTIPFGTSLKKSFHLSNKEKQLRDSVERHKKKLSALQKSFLIEPHFAATPEVITKRSSSREKSFLTDPPFAATSEVITKRSSSREKEDCLKRKRGHTYSYIAKRRRQTEQKALAVSLQEDTTAPGAPKEKKEGCSKRKRGHPYSYIAKKRKQASQKSLAVSLLEPGTQQQKRENKQSAVDIIIIIDDSIEGFVVEEQTIDLTDSPKEDSDVKEDSKENKESIPLNRLSSLNRYESNVSSNFGMNDDGHPQAFDTTVEEKLKLCLREVLTFFVPDNKLPIEECIYNGESTLLSSLEDEFFKEHDQIRRRKLVTISNQICATVEANAQKQKECEAQILVAQDTITTITEKTSSLLIKLNATEAFHKFKELLIDVNSQTKEN